jgi:hypothetical protein
MSELTSRQRDNQILLARVTGVASHTGTPASESDAHNPNVRPSYGDAIQRRVPPLNQIALLSDPRRISGWCGVRHDVSCASPHSIIKPLMGRDAGF